MIYTLVNCTINGTIERIRGEELITVPVNCTFHTTDRDYIVSGIGTCSSTKDISNAFLSAIENAKGNLETILNIKSGGSESPEVLTKIVKLSIESNMATELKRHASSKAEYDVLMTLANEDKQKKVNILCDSLGIDPISVEDTWTNIEVLVLVNYLEKLTAPLVENV